MTDDKLEAWLDKKEKLYTQVIPGVLDSIELEDMRKLIHLVRTYHKHIESLEIALWNSGNWQRLRVCSDPRP